MAALAAAACGASSGNHSGADGGAGTTGDGAGTDGSVGLSDDSGNVLNLSETGGSADAFAGCATTTQKATLAPLDLYFMLDTSGSMDDLVAAGQSKWSSVVAAMTAFVNDSASAGIGVGLQYFPLTAAGVPSSCTSSAQCGAAGPCLLSLCSGLNQTVPCNTDADCPRRSTCVPIGQCQYDHNFLCPNPGAAQCGPDPNGFPLGTCDVLPSSTCVFGDSCVAQDYQTPAVPIALLPGVAATVTASLAAHQPEGNTPTSAALQGAINEASSYARANPGHSVVAVLATDGIPDECAPTIAAIAQIAAVGLAGTPSIKTFTIGVFTPSDVPSGTMALDQIASAGGTGHAFIVNSSTQNVEQQFSAALATIRGAALPCSYQLPSPDGGVPDFGKLNVQYTAGSGAVTTVGYVEASGRCDAQRGGWYYNADPAEGGVPTEILICPATCSTFQSDAKGRVDVVLGCQTVLM
jgi:Mg-chelatase subunit ChlD